MQELEKWGSALFNGKRGDSLRAVADSAEGRALEQKLDPAAVEKAARSGDPAQLQALLKEVLATEEGRALAEKLSGLGF